MVSVARLADVDAAVSVLVAVPDVTVVCVSSVNVVAPTEVVSGVVASAVDDDDASVESVNSVAEVPDVTCTVAS